jgi:N-ethylmaleimide reductase
MVYCLELLISIFSRFVYLYNQSRCTPTEDPYDIVNTIPNEIMGDYYEQRASAGLILTEGTAISEEAAGWPDVPHIRGPEHVEAWKKIIERVHAKGAKIYIQLWHMGRQSHSSFHPTTNRIVSASDVKFEAEAKTIDRKSVPSEVPHPLTIEEIEQTIRDYVNAAALAKEAGFDGIELHGANGYLIDQFLQGSTNKRTDKYGGSIENRARFLLEIIDAIIESGTYPVERIGVKLSPNGVFGEMGHEENYEQFTYVAKELNKYNLAFIELMDGLGFGFHGKSKAVTCMDFKKVFDGPIIANVGFTKETAEGIIRSGAADLVSFGRPYIANPDLVERFTNNWPLAPEAEYQYWWQPIGAKGYSDWPMYKAESDETKE